ELSLSFLCIDSTGQHPTGELTYWQNKVSLSHGNYDKDGKSFIQLEASSPKVEIKYTTDGSNPENNGGIYEEPFAIPEGTKFVQAIAVHEELGVLSEPITIPITDQHIEVIKDQPLTLTKYLESSTTSETYERLEKLA